MPMYARPICAALAIGLLTLGAAGCNSSSKDSKAPAGKMEKMDDKMEDMKMDEKAK